MPTNNIGRPVMLYHGSKFRLAPWIIKHLPDHKNYIEPYGGAAAVMLRKQPSYHEVYNDQCNDVVTVFEVLRDNEKADELERRIRLTPFSREEYDRAYRGEYRDKIERARQVILTSFMGWGATTMRHKSGFRAKARQTSSTQLDVWKQYPDAIEQFSERFMDVVIENRDGIEVIKQQDTPDSLFYVDPPYLPETRNDTHEYEHELDRSDHEDLAAVLHNVEGMVVLSGYKNDLYEQLYGDWTRRDKKTRTQNVDSGAVESIWISPTARKNQPQQELFDDA